MLCLLCSAAQGQQPEPITAAHKASEGKMRDALPTKLQGEKQGREAKVATDALASVLHRQRVSLPVGSICTWAAVYCLLLF